MTGTLQNKYNGIEFCQLYVKFNILNFISLYKTKGQAYISDPS